MKSTKPVVIAIATACLLACGTQSASAQNFRAFVSAVRISTNQNGVLVYHRISNGDIIRNCAREEGITNFTGLSLVYNRTADALQVIRGTNQPAICTPLRFGEGTWLLNSNHTVTERLTFVFVEPNTVAGGTLAATERFRYGPTNQLTSFSLFGELQYTTPAHGTNPPAIYRGRLMAGTGLRNAGHSDDNNED